MLPNAYHQSSSGIWTRSDSTSFNYSDGDDIENRLLQQVEAAADVSLASDELQYQIVDWPSEYHFTPLRANLLSSFHFDHCVNILEIGSGCGAITRLLGEQCPHSDIFALEGSMRRAEITRARCRDLNNVHVYRDSFSDFQHDRSFDLITMIGVLEYSPSYFEGNDPVLKALSRARSMLRSHGVLVIAIENQLGLKYFNGCAEDHNAQAFSGINDQYEPGTVRTFGKKQLQEKIEQAGFNHVEFVYPFPDYKLPQLLLREGAFHDSELDPSYLAGQYASRDYGYDGDNLFQEARVWNLLFQNGLLRDFANSFLVFAFTGGDTSLDDLTDPWLAKAFSCGRKKHYLVETLFSREHDELVVEKKVSYPSAFGQEPDRPKILIHHVGKVDYLEGVPYGYSLPDQVSGEGSSEKFIDYITPWIHWLREQAFPQSTIAGEERLFVPGGLYDCLPANFLITEQGQLRIIDQEWEFDSPLEFGFVLFRGLYRELSENIRFLEQTDLFADGTVFDLAGKIFDRFDVAFNENILARYIDLEITFQLEVIPYSAEKRDLCNHLEGFFKEKRRRKISPGDLLTSGGVRQHSLLVTQKDALDRVLAEREEQISNLKQRLKERDDLLATIYQSNSWKVTSPLRLLGYLIKGDFSKAATMVKKK